MTTRKNPGLGARAKAISAAAAASTAVLPDSGASQWEGEPVKGISIRLPLSLYKRVSTLSFERRQARGAEKKERDAADPHSIHGLMLTALSEYLDKEGS